MSESKPPRKPSFYSEWVEDKGIRKVIEKQMSERDKRIWMILNKEMKWYDIVLLKIYEKLSDWKLKPLLHPFQSYFQKNDKFVLRINRSHYEDTTTYVIVYGKKFAISEKGNTTY